MNDALCLSVLSKQWPAGGAVLCVMAFNVCKADAAAVFRMLFKVWFQLPCFIGAKGTLFSD